MEWGSREGQVERGSREGQVKQGSREGQAEEINEVEHQGLSRFRTRTSI